MKAEQYVGQIVKKLKCSSVKKKDIRMQLISEIEERVAAGENLEGVLTSMGSVDEVVESFQESFSEEEILKFERYKKTIRICIIVFVSLCVLWAVLWMLPKGKKPAKGNSDNPYEISCQKVIENLDAKDYEALQAMATKDMAPYLTEEAMAPAMASIYDGDYGVRQAFGTFYMQEIEQMGETYTMCQMNVSYENTAVTYTFTFDEEGLLAGFFVK